MNTIQKIITLGLLTVILNLLGCGEEKTTNQNQNSTNIDSMNIVSFEEQFETFNKLGFKLNTGTNISDVDRWGGHSEFEKEPYSLMYVTLGQSIEKEPWTPLTNKCLHFDTEAIEDHGSYIAILQNLERLSKGELKFENLKDYVDIESKKAWVSFTINGFKYKWDMKVDDDWVDTDLFLKVVELTNKFGTKGKFTYYNTGGQDAVIGYETPETLEKIVNATKLKIEWLN